MARNLSYSRVMVLGPCSASGVVIDDRPTSDRDTLLKRERVEVQDADDLRHKFARHAVLQGIPPPVVSSPLGHKRPSMRLRYVHVGDHETEAAAERIGTAIARVLGGRDASSSD